MNRTLCRIITRSFVVAVLLVSPVVISADTLALWTFESPNTPADASNTTDVGPYSPAVGSGQASGHHANAASDWSTPVGNGSAESLSANTWEVGDYFQFRVSTLGLFDLGVQFDQTSSGTGPGTFGFFYSNDGTSYTQFGSNFALLPNAAPNPVWNGTTSSSLYTTDFDLSSITALNNQANVYFRLVNQSTSSAGGGTVAAGGTSRVDNFLITATPEPATIVSAGFMCLVAGAGLLRQKYRTA